MLPNVREWQLKNWLKHSRQIARAIVAQREESPIDTTRKLAQREESPIDTTRKLAQLVAQNVRTRERGQDPATRGGHDPRATH